MRSMKVVDVEVVFGELARAAGGKVALSRAPRGYLPRGLRGKKKAKRPVPAPRAAPA